MNTRLAVFLGCYLILLCTAPLRAQKWGDPDLQKYWSQGKAEITRYALSQSRYGELHQGDAVLIFVTEPFSKSKQVKIDDWQTAGDDLLQVLKLNFTKKFLTGIYPYSLMLSIFTPVDASATLKTTMTGQEWCGHVFGQLNLRGDHYDSVDYSYFESEGDTRNSLPTAFLEDEIWTRIRLTPGKLPTGEMEIIPGSLVSRLLHVPLKVEKAKAAFIEPDPATFDPAKIQGYRLDYLTGYKNRSLTIWFEKAAPHRIPAWEETYGEFGKPALTTKATSTAVMMTDYWRRHSDADRILRKDLDLSTEH